jgi:hypothetical protein
MIRNRNENKREIEGSNLHLRMYGENAGITLLLQVGLRPVSL